MTASIAQQVRDKYSANLSGSSFQDSHLGGCGIEGDVATHYPIMWRHLVGSLGIKKIIDVGCGFGYSLNFFKNTLKCEVQGVEGSKKVCDIALMKEHIVHHDYCEGPYVPEEKFDLCWSCEFVEHVSPQFVSHYMETFKKAKYVAITFAGKGQGGHHHVNENTESYWRFQFETGGFHFNDHITHDLKHYARKDFEDPRNPTDNSSAEGWTYPHHFINRGLFFENENF